MIIIRGYFCADRFSWNSIKVQIHRDLIRVKDRHQWLGCGFWGCLLLNMDTLFLKAIIYVLYH